MIHGNVPYELVLEWEMDAKFGTKKDRNNMHMEMALYYIQNVTKF